jgi:Fe2+ or Zn2+ uptake regulation protein
VADRAENILDGLRQRGERITPARRAVVHELVAARGHVTADELVERVQSRVSSAHRATIYRTMDVLERLGVVEHTHLGHGRAVYHLATDVHAHLVCERCGTIVEASPALLAGVERRAQSEHGFALRAHHFALVGLCADCQRRTVRP